MARPGVVDRILKVADTHEAVREHFGVHATDLAAIHRRFGLPAEASAAIKALIKVADSGAAYLEATRLAGFDPAEARRFFGKPPAVSATMERDFLKPWPAETAETRYFERIEKLFGG